MRLCRLIDQYHDRPDEAGQFVRRLLRELDSLWVFLVQHGVEPTNNRAERALRFGVLWRKRSHGTASELVHTSAPRIRGGRPGRDVTHRATWPLMTQCAPHYKALIRICTKQRVDSKQFVYASRL